MSGEILTRKDYIDMANRYRQKIADGNGQPEITHNMGCDILYWEASDETELKRLENILKDETRWILKSTK